MMGIDFIAGDIKRTIPKYGAGAFSSNYGVPPASIGGRTRKWTNINFMQVNKAGGNRHTATAGEIAVRTMFTNASKSALATMMLPANIAVLQAEWRTGTTFLGCNSNTFATMRGWITAVRIAQILNGVDIQPTTTTWPPQTQP
jgi:hypothetical protein